MFDGSDSLLGIQKWLKGDNTPVWYYIENCCCLVGSDEEAVTDMLSDGMC